MIPVRIDRKPEVRDDYANLGRYIAAAREKGEKLDRFWIVNCGAGTGITDIESALIEIEAVRAKNLNVADKTYHLVVSFHPGEEAKLSLADLQDIERTFADALGYGEHQRIAGTHVNTDNFHLHVAFNKLHPETGRCHTPRRDFEKLAKVARAMEAKYGLVVDRGMTDAGERNQVSARARDYEARTWERSFERHLFDHKDAIVGAVAGAGTWRQLHEGLAKYDLVLKMRGAGLVFAEANGGKGRSKASAVDRACSLAALEKRLGPFEAAPELIPAPDAPSRRGYRREPMTRHPGQDRLWRAYLQQKKPGFLRRVLHIRNWKDYLLAEAHKDALALAIILTYKELFHLLAEATTVRRRPHYPPPNSMRPALETWFSGAAWKKPDFPLGKADLDEMDLRADSSGRVLFPFRDASGHVWAVRAMDGDGRSTDVGDSRRSGLSHVIDPGGDLSATDRPFAGQLVVTSDCLTAIVLHKGAGVPVVVSPHEESLAEVAKSLRQRFPGCRIIIAAPAKSASADRAARVTRGELVVIDGGQARAKLIADLVGKGQTVTVDPDQARAMGAFGEEALSPDEAKASRPSRQNRPSRDRDLGR